jgi:hypothetical protein
MLRLLFPSSSDSFSCCESIAYMRYPYSSFLSNSSTFHKYDESLNSSNSIAFSANLGYLNIVFLASFNRLWTAKAAAASKTSSSVRHLLGSGLHDN